MEPRFVVNAFQIKDSASRYTGAQKFRVIDTFKNEVATGTTAFDSREVADNACSDLNAAHDKD